MVLTRRGALAAAGFGLVLVGRSAEAQTVAAAPLTEALAPPEAASWRFRGTQLLAALAQPLPASPCPEFPFAPRESYGTVGSDVPTSGSGASSSAYACTNPPRMLGIGFFPRFSLSRTLQLRAGASWSYAFFEERAGAAASAFSDSFVDLWFHGIPTFYGVRASVAAGVTLPTSGASRADTMRLGLGVGAQLHREVPRALGGSWQLLLRVGYQHRFHAYTTPGIDDTSIACLAIGRCSPQSSPTPNIADDVTWLALVSARWWRFSPGVSFGMRHGFPYALSSLPPPSTARPSMGAPVEPSGAVRNYSTFSAWLDFVIAPWLTAEVRYVMSRNILDGDGTVGNLFWSSRGGAQLQAQVILGLDAIYEAATGGAQGSGGVIRATRERCPATREEASQTSCINGSRLAM